MLRYMPKLKKDKLKDVCARRECGKELRLDLWYIVREFQCPLWPYG